MIEQDVKEIKESLSILSKITISAFCSIVLIMLIAGVSVRHYIDNKFESVQRTPIAGTVLFKDISGIELVYSEQTDLVCFGKICWDIKSAPEGLIKYYTPEMLVRITPPPAPVKIEIAPYSEPKEEEENSIEVDENGDPILN